MNNNDVIRRVRYALDLSNPRLVEVFQLSGAPVPQAEVIALLRKEGEEGFLPCSDSLLQSFLDGLIVLRRGSRLEAPSQPAPREGQLSNNDILKKIRIALELKEADLLEIFKAAGFSVSKSELNALFRARGQQNFKPCGDQMLRNFLKGLTLRYRPDPAVGRP